VQDLQDTPLDLAITGFCRGLAGKSPPYLLPQAWAHRSHRKGAAAALAALLAGASAIQELNRVGE
jgi:hypothetical protein